MWPLPQKKKKRYSLYLLSQLKYEKNVDGMIVEFMPEDD